MRTDYAIKIPYVMGIIATRSTDKEVTGLHDLMKEHEIVFVMVWWLIAN
jgi:cytochrome d ubiquinol oxidase subunit I